MKRLFYIMALICVICGCRPANEPAGTIPILTWAGMPSDKAEECFPIAKECGIDWHLGLYGNQQQALHAMDVAAEVGIGVIPGFPEIKDSTESAVAALKDHPALIAYHLKDEPETWDVHWLKALHDKVQSLDSTHPCYINLYPNWAWNEESYADNIELYASEINTQFYSFDQYPVTEDEGVISVRPTWYRNLEEFSAMARRHGKPFWAFAMAKSHHLGPPSPPAFYPVPTLGHLRLQVFSDLLYGAQVIQYFTFGGIYDCKEGKKTPAFDVFRQVNSEIKAYSPVFLGCTVKGVWHTGDLVPSHTRRLKDMPHDKVKSLDVSGQGAVVSLIENKGRTYLAVQNRDCVNEATLEIEFDGRVREFSVEGPVRFDGGSTTLEPGNMKIFILN